MTAVKRPGLTRATVPLSPLKEPETDARFEDAGPGTRPDPEPYARAQAAWEDRHGVLKTERERWFRVAMLLGVVVIATTALAVWAAMRGEYRTMIVAVDTFGQRAPVIAPQAITDWPEHVVRREVSGFIRDWRAVSTDRAVMRARHRRIQFYTKENSTADRKIVAWANAAATNPYKRSEASTTDIEIHTVNALGGHSWFAEWTEKTRNRSNGLITRTEKFTATITLNRRKVSDPAMLAENPFGMVIEDIDVVRLTQ